MVFPPLKPLVKILNATEKKEKKKIAFLKTHKCSSTTIQNILFRYAYKHKLNVVLPKKGNLIGYPHGFTQKSIENTDWFQAHIKPDIFCMHTKWTNFSAIQEFMGGKWKFVAFGDIREASRRVLQKCLERPQRPLRSLFEICDLKIKDFLIVSYLPFFRKTASNDLGGH